MTPDQVDQAYDDMDDLYFFTRNGYYPAKARQRRAKTTNNTTTVAPTLALLGRAEAQGNRFMG